MRGVDSGVGGGGEKERRERGEKRETARTSMRQQTPLTREAVLEQENTGGKKREKRRGKRRKRNKHARKRKEMKRNAIRTGSILSGKPQLVGLNLGSEPNFLAENFLLGYSMWWGGGGGRGGLACPHLQRASGRASINNRAQSEGAI